MSACRSSASAACRMVDVDAIEECDRVLPLQLRQRLRLLRKQLLLRPNLLEERRPRRLRAVRVHFGFDHGELSQRGAVHGAGCWTATPSARGSDGSKTIELWPRTSDVGQAPAAAKSMMERATVAQGPAADPSPTEAHSQTSSSLPWEAPTCQLGAVARSPSKGVAAGQGRARSAARPGNGLCIGGTCRLRPAFARGDCGRAFGRGGARRTWRQRS